MTMNISEDPEIHSDASDESDDGDQQLNVSTQKAKKSRTTRACLACRRMKTRCEVDEALGNACKLCIRARRQCIMQTIPRRRKRKTTERVADLEHKINELTALLAANESNASSDTRSLPTGATVSSQTQESSPEQITQQEKTLFAEAVDRGLLNWQTACKAFDRYKHDMCQRLPFVVFPASSEANCVKEQQPLLFFAIVTAALSTMRTTVDSELSDMLTKDLASRIMYRGERSLELVQTLLIHVSWYARAKQMRELNFNQMVHIASTMALDIGLGRRSHIVAPNQDSDPHPLESLAGRRAWLGCYYAATR